MRPNILIGATLAACIGLAGCQTLPLAENATTLNVSFHWTAESGCSAVSPPIWVTNVPPSTRYLRVRMVDPQKPSSKFNGGEVAFAGSGQIREGALKFYRGPCPSTEGQAYGITVQALDVGRREAIAQGSAERQFPS